MAGDIKNLKFVEGVNIATPGILKNRYFTDDAVNWDGTNTSHVYDVSSDIDDAELAEWSFLDNANGFRNVNGAVITKTTTTVTVTFTVPPVAGTYRLLGVA